MTLVASAATGPAPLADFPGEGRSPPGPLAWVASWEERDTAPKSVFVDAPVLPDPDRRFPVGSRFESSQRAIRLAWIVPVEGVPWS